MRFTLQPIFTSPARQFRCHLQRRRPQISYQLWFYVSVRKANFETPRTRVNVSQTTSASGRHVTEFLSVEQVTGLLPTADDVIITGRRDDATAAEWNYTVLPVRDHVAAGSGGDAWRRIESHAISNNIRVLTAEPDEPFAFSTSSWVLRSTSCNVDVTHFRPVNKTSRRAESDEGQEVMADVRSRDGAFEYRLKSSDNDPHIKFLIPGVLFSLNQYITLQSFIVLALMYRVLIRHLTFRHFAHHV